MTNKASAKDNDELGSIVYCTDNLDASEDSDEDNDQWLGWITS